MKKVFTLILLFISSSWSLAASLPELFESIYVLQNNQIYKATYYGLNEEQKGLIGNQKNDGKYSLQTIEINEIMHSNHAFFNKKVFIDIANLKFSRRFSKGKVIGISNNGLAVVKIKNPSHHLSNPIIRIVSVSDLIFRDGPIIDSHISIPYSSTPSDADEIFIAHGTVVGFTTNNKLLIKYLNPEREKKDLQLLPLEEEFNLDKVMQQSIKQAHIRMVEDNFLNRCLKFLTAK